MLLLALLAQAGMAPTDFDRLKRAIPACLDPRYLTAIDALPEKDRREAEIICLAFTLGEDQGRAVKPNDMSEKA